MKSVLAIVAGSVFIVVAILIMQLAYVLLAVEYNSLATSFAVLNDIRGLFRYLVGVPVFMLIMFFGGIITAGIVNSRVLLHCLAVGIVTSGGMIWLPMRDTEVVTLTGIVVSLLAITTTMAGGFYSSRNFSED